MDDRLFRNAMGRFATGVTVITTEVEGEVHGMTANAFLSVSLNPKLILVSIGEKARMLSKLQQAQKYAVSFLAGDQQELSIRFAGQLKDNQQFEFDTFNGMPVLKGALAQMTCNVVAEHQAGDHTLFVGEVTDIALNEGEPLVFYQGKYRELKEQAAE